MLTTQYTFPDGTGFTYDAAKIDFAANRAKLKDQRPANALFYASFASSINGNWGSGTLAGTATGAVPTPAGTLDLRGSTLKYVSWNSDNVATLLQVGCIRLGYIPNYSGAPSTNQAIVGKGNSSTDKNQLDIIHLDDGHLICRVYSNTSGITIFSMSAAWSPVAGTEYEIEFNFDALNGSGAARVFVNGVQLGTTATGTGSVVLGSTNQFRVGTQIGGASLTSNFQLSYLAVWDAVQHTAAYSAPSPALPETEFSMSNPSIYPTVPLTLDQITDLSAVVIASGSDGVKFQQLVGSTLYWWDGDEWTEATADTYTEANTAAEALAHMDTLPGVDDGIFYAPVMLLHSADGSTTPELESVTVTYSFHADEPTRPNVCTVWGYILSPAGAPVANAVISAVSATPPPATYVASEHIVAQGTPTARSNSQGYFEMDLIETETTSKQLTFSVNYGTAGVVTGTYSFGKATVPNVPDVNFATLTFT